MGKNTKILFTDLDGTLLNDEKEVTAGNQAAIDRALEQGHKNCRNHRKASCKRAGYCREDRSHKGRLLCDRL